ncbi:MAG: sigma-70 family RNA polymerase sigma factor [Chloroflexi bacterium]|nr:sigma-70 family RNA polymerase sigma factor [Chloroflexota bacterium]
MDKQIPYLADTGQDLNNNFRELYDQWIVPVYRYCLSRTGNTAVAEDITSQVFLSIYQALPRYRHKERLAPWLFTITRNKIRDHYRKSNREFSVDKDFPDPHGVDLLELASQTEQIDKLRTLVNALPRACWPAPPPWRC